MRSWLPLAAIFAALAIGWTIGRGDGSLEAARAAEAKIGPLRHEVDSLSREVDRAYELVDMTARSYSADSLRWAQEREALALRSHAASETAGRLADRLRAIGDSTVIAVTDSLEAAYTEALQAKDAQIAGLMAERFLLFGVIDARDDLIGAMQDENEGLRILLAQQAATIEAFKAAADPGWLARFTSDLPKYAAGALVGAVVWEIAR